LCRDNLSSPKSIRVNRFRLLSPKIDQATEGDKCPSQNLGHRLGGIWVKLDERLIDVGILNVVDRTLEVYRQPQPTGRYGEVRVLTADEQIEIESLLGESFLVRDLFPPTT